MKTKGNTVSAKLKSYPEPEGYANVPGLVKSNPKNNKSYLIQSLNSYPYWTDLLIDLDEEIEELLPGYNIAQIKNKFSEMRFRFDAPRGATVQNIEKAELLVREAQSKSNALLKKYRAENDK